MVKFEYVKGKEITKPEDFDDCKTIFVDGGYGLCSIDVGDGMKTQHWIDKTHHEGYRLYHRLKKVMLPVFTYTLDEELEETLFDFAHTYEHGETINTHKYLKRIKEILGL